MKGIDPNGVRILRLLQAGKRILGNRSLWRLVEPSFVNGVINSRISILPDNAIKALIADGYAVAYQSIASEYHGWMVSSSLRDAPKYDPFERHNPKYRMLHWTQDSQLYLTDAGRALIAQQPPDDQEGK